MTSPRDPRARRRGLLASLSDVLAPRQIPENDTGPLIAPKSVIVSTVLAMVAGVVYLIWGGFVVSRIGAMMQSAQTGYATQRATCTSSFGGIGTSAVATPSPTGLARTCAQLPVMTTADWSNIRTINIALAVVFIVLGALLVLGGWFLRAGATWARRTLVGITVITLLAAFLGGLTSTLVLAATFLMLVAVVLCYVSSGATFFLRVKARRHT